MWSPVNTRSGSIDSGPMWASAPTARPRAFSNLCRGRCPHAREAKRSKYPWGIAPSTYDSTTIDAAGHAGPALQHCRRASVEFVGATLSGRPSTQGAARQNGGGMWASRPTKSRGSPLQQDRGRSVSPVGGGVHDAPLQRAVPQGRDSPQRGEMSPQGDREGGGHFLALRAHSVDKRQPLQHYRGLFRGLCRGGFNRPRRGAKQVPLGD